GAPTPIVCCTTTTGSPPPSATSIADAIFGRDSACGGYWISSGPPKYSCWTSMSTRARRGVGMEFSSADRAQPLTGGHYHSIIAWADPAHEWHRCTVPMDSRDPRWVARDAARRAGLGGLRETLRTPPDAACATRPVGSSDRSPASQYIRPSHGLG